MWIFHSKNFFYHFNFQNYRNHWPGSWLIISFFRSAISLIHNTNRKEDISSSVRFFDMFIYTKLVQKWAVNRNYGTGGNVTRRVWSLKNTFFNFYQKWVDKFTKPISFLNSSTNFRILGQVILSYYFIYL